jgi:inner membrane protein
MPSVLTHPAVPLAIAGAYGRLYVPGRLLLAGVIASVLPDVDSVGLHFGVPYGALFGHRGFSHSLAFALLLAVAAALGHRYLDASASAAFAVVLLSAASHGLLDAFTDGGLGIAFFSPVSNHRYFLPWRPLAVSPLGVHRFFSQWGLRVIRSEALWVWLPSSMVALFGYLIRRNPRGA